MWIRWIQIRNTGLEVDGGGRDEPEYLLAAEEVVPHARPAQVHVEICVAAGDGHEAVLLDLQ